MSKQSKIVVILKQQIKTQNKVFVRVLLKNVTHHSSTTKNKTFVTVD